jgi:N-acyl-D-aspartate/D-glutamate deacylase
MELKKDSGRTGLESVLKQVDKLKHLRVIGLSKDILSGLNPKTVDRYRQRAATEHAWELRRHPESIRYPLLVFYCIPRESEIIDSLIELLIQIIHRISVRAERRAIKEIVDSIRKVRGKTNILFRIAEAALENPEGTIRNVIFPVAGQL